MPNILTHYTFAKENILDPNQEHLLATYVGSQGPDPWFFYGTIPWRPRPHHHEVTKVGEVTQHLEITEEYDAMLEYAYKNPCQEALFAYIDGLFMHYAVDRTCHPYIFYNTGFTDRPTDPKEVQAYYNFGHLWMEEYIDYIIAHREGTFCRPDLVLKMKKEDLKAISKMWYTVNLAVQKVPFVKENSFVHAIEDYRGTMKAAWDPKGWKKPLAKKTYGPTSLIYGLIYPQSIAGFEDLDFLNEKHSEWRMPAGERRHESFDELLKEAQGIYAQLHALLLRAKEGEDVKEDLATISAHLNHEGIVPGSPKIYWKLIWHPDFLKDIIDHPAD